MPAGRPAAEPARRSPVRVQGSSPEQCPGRRDIPEFHPDFQPQSGEVVAHEHWAQSGFANTDLDAQLRQHGITHVVTIGLLANTCIESTSRFAMELGHHVTLVRDATAAVQPAMMHAAHELNGPTFAHAIVTTADVVTAFKAAARP